MQLQGRAVAHINRNRETLLTFGAACRGKNLISGALAPPMKQTAAAPRIERMQEPFRITACPGISF